MPEDLKKQSAILDNPDVETTAQAEEVKEIEEVTLNYSDLIKSLPSSRGMGIMSAEQEDASAVRRSMLADQQQGEFDSYDPGLDRGLKAGDDQNEVRARNQTGWAQLGRGTVGALNEAVLGTLESAALLGDVEMHIDSFNGVETEFSNTLSRYLKETKESIAEEYGKVYVAKEDEGFSPMSGSFWASNASSLMSAVTLMIPATGATKALTGLAKLSKVGKVMKVTRGTQQTLKGVTTAVLSRLGENAMEAAEASLSTRDTLKDTINPKTGVNYTEEEINVAAGEAGTTTWKWGWMGIVPDMFQYTKMFRGVDHARKMAGKAAKKTLLKSVGGFALKDMGSEGIEEGYQYVLSKEAQRSAIQKASGVDDGTSFMARLAEYIQEDEFKTSVLMGAVGGGIFSGAGAINSYKEKRAQNKQRASLEEVHAKNESLLTNNSERFEQAEEMGIVNQAMDYASRGELDKMEKDLKLLATEEDSDLVENGIDPKAYKEKVSKALKTIKNVGKIHNSVMNDSNIPDILKSATVYSRSNRKVQENRRAELSKVEDAIDAESLETFSGKEASTAEMMVRVKKLLRNGNKEKADKLIESIVETSDKYKDKADVLSNLDIAEDSIYTQLESVKKDYDKHIKRAIEFEDQLKTEEGQKKLVAQAKREIAKAEKKKKEETKNKDSQEQANRTDEQLKQDAAVAEAVKEFGEFDTPKPDGTKVFTTSHKQGTRSWVKGETVRDPNGKMYNVVKPVSGGHGVLAFEVDTNGKRKTGKDGKPIYKTFYNLSELSPESKKPGTDEWSVNKFQYENKDEIERAKEKEVNIHNDLVSGTVKTVNKEYSNWTRQPNGSYAFEGDTPAFDEDNDFDIDFELAASPMEDGVTQKVTLEIAPDSKYDAILVKQGDKIVSKVALQGREIQFKALMEYIGDNGGSIEADLIGKRVTYSGNLGNVIGKSDSVFTLKDSVYLPDGKIFIGSVKPGEAAMTFVAEDGTIIDDIPWDSESKSSKYASGAKTGEGNTYILLKNPEGKLVPVMLQEAMLADITTEGGITLHEKVMQDLENAADEMTKEMNLAVEAYVKKGHTITIAIEKVMKEYSGVTEKTEDSDFVPSILMARTNEITKSILRMQGNEVVRGKDGKPMQDGNGNWVKAVGKNYFTLKLEYQPVREEVAGQEVLETGKVVIKATTSIPSTFENPDPDKAFIHKATTDTAEVSEIISNRFASTSIDEMKGENGGKYVQKLIKEKWVTTDVSPIRTWVNPQLIIKLDQKATTTTAGDAKEKKYKKPSSRSRKSSAKVVSDSDNSKDAIKTAKKAITKVIDFVVDPDAREAKAKKGGITFEEFTNTYLNGLVEDPQELLQDILEQALADKRPEVEAYAKVRESAKSFVTDFINDAFDAGDWNHVTEETNGDDIGSKEEVNTAENDKLTELGYDAKEIDKLSENAKRIIIKNNTRSPREIKVKARTPKAKDTTAPDSKSKTKTNKKGKSLSFGKTSEPKENRSSEVSEPSVKSNKKQNTDPINTGAIDKLLNDLESGENNLSSEAKSKIQKDDNTDIECD